MKKQTWRMLSWAAGALLATVTTVFAPGCGSDEPSSPNTVITAGSGGSAGTTPDGGTGGTNVGGSSGKGGSSGNGGTSDQGGTSGSSGTGGSAGSTGGNSGTGGTDVDAGGSAGTDAEAGGASGEGGEAGFGSKPNLDGGDAAGSAGQDAGAGGAAGTGGTPFDGGSAGSSGTGGTSGSSGTGGTGSGGTGGTIVVPCPADCSGHGSCNTQTGVCTCAIGFDGAACDTCAAGYKNYPECYAIQTCPANCSGHGTCNDKIGVCTCNTGYDTANCGACATGYTGYPNCQVAPQPFACANWTRNSAFDSFKIDGNDVSLVGGIWGTSASNIYVTAATYSKGVVAHWTGSQWVREDLATMIQGSPAMAEEVHGVWGSGPNDIWVASRGNSGTQGMLFHKTSGAWAEDANEPYAKSFESVWGSDASNVFVTGWKTTGYKVWRKSGSSWVDMAAPTPWTYGRYYHVWGLDANHVFVTASADDNGDSNPDHGILLYFDGNSWTSVQVPADCKELRSIHGTSFGDLWASGITTSGKGVVYRITDNLTTWMPYVNQGLAHYQPIFSARFGTALAVGGTGVVQAGNLRVTTIDQVSQPVTVAVDAKAYGPGVDVWYNAGKAWFVSISDNGGTYPGAVYSADCN